MKKSLLAAAILGLSTVMTLSGCGIVNTSSSETSNSTSTSEVAKAEISISGESSVKMGETLQLTANVTNLSNYTLKWSSSNSSIARIDDNGLIQTVSSVTKDETVTITVSVVGQTDLSATKVITIKKDDNTSNVTVAITGENKVNIGKSITLTATVNNATNKAVTWSSSNDDIASVDANGVVTAKTDVATSTTIEITATSVEDNTKFNTHIINVVVPGPIKVTLSGADHVTMGKSVDLICSIENAYNEEITWTSSNENVATVSNTGKVTAKEIDHNTTVTITATSVQDNTKSDSLTLKVWVGEKEEDDVYVEQATRNKNFVLFDNNRSQDANSATGYMIQDRPHFVGDDNTCNFKPELIFFRPTADGDTENVSYKGDWKFEIEIYENVDGTLTKLEANNNYIDGIDYINALVDFSSEAIGHSFQVKVVPGRLTENQKNLPDFEEYFVTRENVTVTDGYNVYNADELAYIDNREAGPFESGEPKDAPVCIARGNAWKQFKTEKGLKTGYFPNALILQTNLEVTIENIPDIFYWDDNDTDFPADKTAQAYVRNTLRDKESIYKRYSANDGGSITMLGNYYSLDASKMPLIVYDDNNPTAQGKYLMPDVNLFEFRSVVNYIGSADSKVSYASVQDMYLKGNGSRQNDPKYSGSLTMFNNFGNNSLMKNIVTISWYQSFSGSVNQYNGMELSYCKGSDDFTGFVFGYNCHHIIIDHCDFSLSGGPCIVAQDWMDTKQTPVTHKSTNVTITNSNIECYINGSEGWFAGMSEIFQTNLSNYVFQLLSMSDLFAAHDSSFIKTVDGIKYMNMISIHMSTAGIEPARSIEGSIKIDGGERLYCGDKNIPMTDTPVDPLFSGAYNDYCVGAGAPLFRSAGGDYAIYNPEANPTDIIPLVQHENSQESTMYKGDYLGIYYLGMLITVDYYHIGK